MNAFVVPNGTIFFTAGMLGEIKDEQMLTFVLAHEMAHYAHRDHLKGSGRQIIGNNNAAVKFMQLIDEKQNIPQYMHYFSTHPAPSERIYLLKHNR